MHGHCPVVDGRLAPAGTAQDDPGPVPQVTWNRGTEFPDPAPGLAAAFRPAGRPGTSAYPGGPPARARFFTGGKLDIMASAHCLRGASSPRAGRTKAEPSQSRQGGSREVVHAQPALLGGSSTRTSARRTTRTPARPARRPGSPGRGRDREQGAGLQRARRRSHEAGEAGPHDHDVRVHGVTTA